MSSVPPPHSPYTQVPAAVSRETPPRFVPTLTQIVSQEEMQALGVVPDAHASAPTVANALPDADALANAVTPVSNLAGVQLQQRMLEHIGQQVDTALERHIREAVSSVALSHARAIAEELRPAIESAVTSLVEQAVLNALALELGDKSSFKLP